MRQAISYHRFSSTPQEQGDSLRRQASGFKRFCEQHDLVAHPENFTDKGKSSYGTSSKEGKHRQGDFGRLLARVKEFKGCVLVIEDMDRFSRECPIDSLNTLQQICKYMDVGIVTENKVFTLADLSDTGNLLRIVIRASIAHEESAKKSMRIKEKWQAKREAMTKNKKFSGRCPDWLQWNGTEYEIIPESKEVIQRIIKDVIAGQGAFVIASRLNAAGVKRIGRTKKVGLWHTSYIKRLIHNRAMIGEHTPINSEPIPNYYPPIVSEADFFRAQKETQSRFLNKTKGRSGPRCTNLFQGLLTYIDGHHLVIAAKGSPTSRKQLVSAGAIRGFTKWIGFPYEPFEIAMLSYLKCVPLGDVLGERKATALEDEKATTEGRLASITTKIAKIKLKMKNEDGNFDALMGLMSELEGEQKQLKKQLDNLKGQMAVATDDTITNTLELLNKLDKLQGDELLTARYALRAKIKSFIDNIYCEFQGNSVKREALVQVHFKGGGFQLLQIIKARGNPAVFCRFSEKRPDEYLKGDMRNTGGRNRAS